MQRVIKWDAMMQYRHEYKLLLTSTETKSTAKMDGS